MPVGSPAGIFFWCVRHDAKRGKVKFVECSRKPTAGLAGSCVPSVAAVEGKLDASQELPDPQVTNRIIFDGGLLNFGNMAYQHGVFSGGFPLARSMRRVLSVNTAKENHDAPKNFIHAEKRIGSNRR